MQKPDAPYISWDPENLSRHHEKRTTKDSGCFEELMGLAAPPPSMTENQYELRSREAVANAWAEFEGRGRDIDSRTYVEARAYYVDNDLVCSITDIKRKKFVTCFHDGHPAGRHFHAHYHDPDKSVEAIGNRRLKYLEKIKQRVKGKLIIDFNPIRGVSDV